jgi:hypothetical protein
MASKSNTGWLAGCELYLVGLVEAASSVYESVWSLICIANTVVHPAPLMDTLKMLIKRDLLPRTHLEAAHVYAIPVAMCPPT